MTALGKNGLSIERQKNSLTLYQFNIPVKTIAVNDAFKRRLLTVELVNDYGVNISRAAKGLEMSRTTVYNTLKRYENDGVSGLFHRQTRTVGNKARSHEKSRKDRKVNHQQITLPLYEPSPDCFTEPHDWQSSRYAGGLIFSALLEKDWQFMSFFSNVYGKFFHVFIVFAQMLVHGIQSIEQLKAIRRREFRLVCGMDRMPSRQTFSKQLHVVTQLGSAVGLIKRFFLYQLKSGLVSSYLLYVDGHFIPYSGKASVHKGYSTQRRLAMPGQTNLVFHDATGRIVYFQLEEGKGNLRQVIESLSKEVQEYFKESVSPLIVSDREVWSIEHFNRMLSYRFLTWEKHTDSAKIDALSEDEFSEPVVINDHIYRFYEFPQKKRYFNSDKTKSIDLRRIVIWNLSSDCRSVCVSNDGHEKVQFLGQAMLGRWGKSENGFKYLKERFNPHYIPLMNTAEESLNQEVDNPIVKELMQQINKINKQLQKNANELVSAVEYYNRDGTIRANSKRQRLLRERSALETELNSVKQRLEAVPARISKREASHGKKSIKIIDREAKNCFDLVQAMVWNARRTLVDILKNHYSDPRDVVNLLDHITHSHGWIKNTEKTVMVRLEPMDLPAFRNAQKEFCRALNNLKSQLPNGKLLMFSVGDKPN